MTPSPALGPGPHPAVLVLNPYYTGVGIARSLPRQVRVFALTSEPGVPGARSNRFSGIHIVANGRDEPERLCEQIATIAARFDTPPVLFPTRDLDILVLHEHRDALERVVRLPYVDSGAALACMDKLLLSQAAQRAGIAGPRTALAATEGELREAAATLRFPLVAKPRFAYEWRRRGRWERVGAQKAFIASSVEELLALYPRLAAVTPQVLLQEYVPGEDRDIVVCCCVVRRDGSLAGHYSARKLRQDPPLVGTGSVVMADDVPGLVDTTVRLLQALDYRGIAEVEYKRDTRGGDFQLIEINPRHWDQHETGRFVGVNISWLAYADIAGIDTARARPTYRADAPCKWIAESEFVAGTARQLRDRLRRADGPRGVGAALSIVARTLRELAALVRGRRIYAMCRWRDPLPGLLVLWSLARQAPRLVRRRSATTS